MVDCEHHRRVFIQGSHASGIGGPAREHVEVCADCGLFRIRAEKEGIHFKLDFSLWSSAALIAASQCITQPRDEKTKGKLTDRVFNPAISFWTTRGSALNVLQPLEWTENGISLLNSDLVNAVRRYLSADSAGNVIDRDSARQDMVRLVADGSLSGSRLQGTAQSPGTAENLNDS